MDYQEVLKVIAKKDDSIIVMTSENMALIRDLPEVLKERFIDTGITEQTLIGSSAGLALMGKKPIVHALSAFLTMRAFEFIRTDIGISSAPVKLIGFIPNFTPSLLALSIVASTPASTALQVSCQSRTASPESPFENEERCNALFPSGLCIRIISRIASVDSNLANECSLAIFTAVVDFPTPVAPAINTRIGGRPVTLVVVASAIPIRFAIICCCSCLLIKTTPNGRGFEVFPLGLTNDERTDANRR